MRAVDQVLADAVLEPTFVFMRAQTDKARLNMNGFARYFEYREKDVGKGFVRSPKKFLFPFRENLVLKQGTETWLSVL